MADTEYHIPFPMPGTITQVMSREEYNETIPPINWKEIDRLITFMAYVILDRALRAGSEAMDTDIRFQIIERLATLMEWCKNGEPYGTEQ